MLPYSVSRSVPWSRLLGWGLVATPIAVLQPLALSPMGYTMSKAEAHRAVHLSRFMGKTDQINLHQLSFGSS